MIAGKLSQQLSVHAAVCGLPLHCALPLHLRPAADVQREEDKRRRREWQIKPHLCKNQWSGTMLDQKAGTSNSSNLKILKPKIQ